MASSVQIPALEYKYEGLDAQASTGYDLYQKSERDYMGIALLVGISSPWIDTQKSSSQNNSAFSNIYKKSKTKILTCRIGPSFDTQTSLGKFFSLYASGTFAYQTARIKNDYAHTDMHVNGWFSAADAGLRFQALSYDKKILGITLSPGFYATLGTRYSYWKFKDVAIDVSGTGTAFDKSDMSMSTFTGYVGIGYSF